MDFSSLPQYPDRPPQPGTASEPPKEEHPREWRDANVSEPSFRAGRWGLVGSFILFVPLMGLGFALGISPGVPFLVIALVMLVSSVLVGNFRCPHCGKTFVKSWWWRNPLTSKCVHCGYRLPRRLSVPPACHVSEVGSMKAVAEFLEQRKTLEKAKQDTAEPYAAPDPAGK